VPRRCDYCSIGLLCPLLAAQEDARLDDPRRRHSLDFVLWRKVTTELSLSKAA